MDQNKSLPRPPPLSLLPKLTPFLSILQPQPQLPLSLPRPPPSLSNPPPSSSAALDLIPFVMDRFANDHRYHQYANVRRPVSSPYASHMASFRRPIWDIKTEGTLVPGYASPLHPMSSTAREHTLASSKGFVCMKYAIAGHFSESVILCLSTGMPSPTLLLPRPRPPPQPNCRSTKRQSISILAKSMCM